MKLLKKILTAVLFKHHAVPLSDANAWEIVPYFLS
jgi:hypothetical protein